MAKIYLARKDVGQVGEHTYFVFDPDGDPTTEDERIIRGGPAGNVLDDDRYLVEVDRPIEQSFDALNGDDPFEDRWYTTIHEGPLDELQDVWDGAVEHAKALGELGLDPREDTHDEQTGEAPDAYFLPEDSYWLTGPNCNCVTNTVGEALGVNLGETLPKVGGDMGSGEEQVATDYQYLGQDMVIGTTGDDVFDVDENNKKFFDQGGSDVYEVGPEDLDGFNEVRINEDSDASTVDKIKLSGYDPDEITLYRNPISGDMVIGTPDGIIIIEDQFSGDGVPGINILELDPPGDGPNIQIPLTNPDNFPTALPQPLPSIFDDFLDDWGDALDEAVSPLVLDLDGDGIELASVIGSDAVYWDIDNDGFLEQSGFVTGDDGLLAVDLNGDGIINNHSELFGTEVTDGFTILSNYDSNFDGVIDSNDTQFSDLIVWVDANSDGYSASDEMFSLSDLGITDISLNASLVDYEISGNQITHEATFTINGQTQTIVDAWFSYDNLNSIYAQDYTPDVRTLYLPRLRGFGDLKDLSTAMSEDETLLLLVQDLAVADQSQIFDTAFDLNNKIDEILYRWAGVDGVDPTSRGPDFDAQKLGFMEAIFGDFDPLVRGSAIDTLSDMYSELKSVLTAQLLVQTGALDNFGEDAYYDANLGVIVGSDISALHMVDSAETNLEATDMGQTHVITADNASLDIWEEGGVDNLWLSGVSQDGYRLEKSGNYDLKVHIGSETITLRNQLYSDYIGSDSYDYYQIENLLLDDGTSIDLTNNITFTGTASGENVHGLKNGNSVLYGLDGNDSLSGYNGNDILIGGAGDEWLYGGNGDDQYVWSVGDGNDNISEQSGLDQLVMHGVTESDLRFEKSGSYDLTIHVGSESIILRNQLHSDYIGSNTADYYQVETLLLDDGTVIELTDNITFTGTASGENVYGLKNGNSVLYGLDGNDSLSGYNGNDILIGGAGDDWMYGGNGDDQYVWSVGDGNDNISEENGVDQLVMHGVTESDLRFEKSGSYDLKIHIDSESIILRNQLYSDYVGSNSYDSYQVETLLLDDGTIIDLTGGLTFTGTANGESLNGLKNSDTVLYGLEGNDYLTAYNGDDVLYGGGGADHLYGQGGADTFVFDDMNAIDTVWDFSLADGDKLDISDLISGYDPLTDAITDFVQITDSGSNSIVSVDADGGADNFVQIATLSSVTGLTDEDALETSGNLIAA